MASAQRPRPHQPTLRLSSERYLRAQPGVRVMLRGFLREVLLQRPDDILEFAAGYFTQPELPDGSRRSWSGGSGGGDMGSPPHNKQ